MKKTQLITHRILQCQQCAWESEKWKTAEKEAKAHVRKTGHTVSGEYGMAVTIKPTVKKL